MFYHHNSRKLQVLRFCQLETTPNINKYHSFRVLPAVVGWLVIGSLSHCIAQAPISATCLNQGSGGSTLALSLAPGAAAVIYHQK